MGNVLIEINKSYSFHRADNYEKMYTGGHKKKISVSVSFSLGYFVNVK